MARQGTLTLSNGYTLPLDNPHSGWHTTKLDLGYPEVREDAEVQADQHGETDYTHLFGKRVVTIEMTLSDDTRQAMTVDELLMMLAPFLDPGQRPVLTYSLGNRDGPETFRTLTLRAQQLTAPLVAVNRTDIQLSFVAPDPRAYSAEAESISLWASDPAQDTGRTYDLVPERSYPAIAGPQSGVITNNGALVTWLRIRFYGPVTEPIFTYAAPLDELGNQSYGCIAFVPTFTIPAGQFVDVDTRHHTVLLGGTSSRFSSLDFTKTLWTPLAPMLTYRAHFSGTGTSDQSQCLVMWNDAYLI